MAADRAYNIERSVGNFSFSHSKSWFPMRSLVESPPCHPTRSASPGSVMRCSGRRIDAHEAEGPEHRKCPASSRDGLHEGRDDDDDGVEAIHGVPHIQLYASPTRPTRRRTQSVRAAHACAPHAT